MLKNTFKLSVCIVTILMLLLHVTSSCSTPDLPKPESPDYPSEDNGDSLAERYPSADGEDSLAERYPGADGGDSLTERPPGFNSPEDAVIAYLEALRDADLSRIMNTFAITDTNNYETFFKDADELSFDNIAVGINKFCISVGMEKLKGEIAAVIINQYNTLCSFESGRDIMLSIQMLRDEKETTKLLAQLNAVANSPKLNKLKVLGFVPPENLPQLAQILGITNFNERYFTEITEDGLDEVARKAGANGMASCIAVFEIDRNPYIQCFETYQYGDRWYIAQHTGSFGRVITNALQLEQDTNGLLPLFWVDMYTGVDNNMVKTLRDEVFAAMKRVDNPTAKTTVSSVNTPVVYEGAGYDSPASAAKVYLQGLRDENVGKMLSAFAIESRTRNFDFEKYYNNLSVYDPSLGFPNANNFVISMNIERYKLEVISSMLSQYTALCLLQFEQSSPEALAIYSEADAEAKVSQALELLNLPKLSTLNVLGYIPLEKLADFSSFLGGVELPDSYFADSARDLFNQRANALGADDLVGCITVFELDGYTYLLCLDAIDYSGKWYINQLGGSLASFMMIPYSFGGLLPLSEISDIGGDLGELRELIDVID